MTDERGNERQGEADPFEKLRNMQIAELEDGEQKSVQDRFTEFLEAATRAFFAVNTETGAAVHTDRHKVKASLTIKIELKGIEASADSLVISHKLATSFPKPPGRSLVVNTPGFGIAQPTRNRQIQMFGHRAQAAAAGGNPIPMAGARLAGERAG